MGRMWSLTLARERVGERAALDMSCLGDLCGRDGTRSAMFAPDTSK